MPKASIEVIPIFAPPFLFKGVRDASDVTQYQSFFCYHCVLLVPANHCGGLRLSRLSLLLERLNLRQHTLQGRYKTSSRGHIHDDVSFNLPNNALLYDLLYGFTKIPFRGYLVQHEITPEGN